MSGKQHAHVEGGHAKGQEVLAVAQLEEAAGPRDTSRACST